MIMRGATPYTVLFVLALCISCASFSKAGYGDRGTFSGSELSARFEADVGTTYELTIKALADLGIVVANAGKEETRANIRAVRPKDKTPVTIDLDWRRHETTEATIKVGAGDEGYSRTIAKAIDTRVSEWHIWSDRKAQPGRPTTAY